MHPEMIKEQASLFLGAIRAQVEVLYRLGFPVDLFYNYMSETVKGRTKPSFRPITLEELIINYTTSGVTHAVAIIKPTAVTELRTYSTDPQEANQRYVENVYFRYTSEVIEHLAEKGYNRRNLKTKEACGFVYALGDTFYVHTTPCPYNKDPKKRDPRWTAIINALYAVLNAQNPIRITLRELSTDDVVTVTLLNFKSFHDLITNQNGSVEIYCNPQGQILLLANASLKNVEMPPSNVGELSAQTTLTLNGTYLTDIVIQPNPIGVHGQRG